MTALINATALLILGLSMASHEWILATFNRLPLRGQITLIIVPAGIVIWLMTLNLPGAW